MKWFEGSINEAVATSKSRKAIFVVFIEGSDESSSQVARAINDTEVSNRLERDDFVAIRLESGSESYRFFAQIYQLVPVPSLFFIGENGAPLEVIAGEATSTDLISKIDLVLTKAGKNNKHSSINLIDAEKKANDVPTVSDHSDPVTSTAQESQNAKKVDADETTTKVLQKELPTDDNPVKTSNINVEEPSSSEATEVQSEVNREKSPSNELTMEEKVERARKLIELQRKQHIEEEERKERERELERRKMGRDVQKLRQKQQDLEAKQAHEERLKEKAAEAAAREKVRQQIAQDKLERKQKELALQQQAQHGQSQEQPKPQAPVVHDATVARIQFRLPTGNPHMGQFEPTSTLRTLRTYVIENIALPFQQFVMSTSFPRRELTAEDDNKTLLDLELVPTAVILILPLKSSNASTSVTAAQNFGSLSRFIWGLLAPIFGIYNCIVGYFTGRPRRSTEQEREDASGSTDATGAIGGIAPNLRNIANSSGLIRRNLGNQGGTVIGAEGNIRRLRSGGSDNDENNTWNGNSTQQM
ncbi:hypothetical protein KM043_008365 [Ampulex compressa]|nr:hypothetical protein KM043_008365 [Ampulex compressa]